VVTILAQNDISPELSDTPVFRLLVAVAWGLAALMLIVGFVLALKWIKVRRLRREAARATPEQQLSWRIELMTQLLELVGRDISRSKRIKTLRKRLRWDIGRLALVLDYLEGRGLVERFTWGADEPSEFTKFVAEVLGGHRIKLTSAGLDEGPDR
jgi:hypothetical protein